MTARILAAAAAAATPELDGLAGLAVDLMQALGLVGVAIAVGADNLFPPIPSELILPLAGFAAAQGTFGLLAAIVAATLGSVLGAFVLYGVGARIGRARVLRVFEVVPLIKPEDFERTEAWFAKHGTKAVFFGRMVPLFRSLVSLPAGVDRMRLGTFLLLTTAGSLLWNSIFIVAGYQLGANWQAVEPWTERFQSAVLAAVALAVVGFVALRAGGPVLAARRGRSRPDDADG
ncbi:MAG: DedA family protein [Nocardioides sp.]|nr:DedA family protein [Nocardioides sp.]